MPEIQFSLVDAAAGWGFKGVEQKDNFGIYMESDLPGLLGHIVDEPPPSRSDMFVILF